MKTDRIIKGLHRDYERGITRVVKWKCVVADLQFMIVAQNKDLDDIEKRLDKMGAQKPAVKGE